MRITMKALCALPSGAREPGRTYDEPIALAKDLIAKGYALPAAEDPAAGGTRKRKPAKKQARKKAAKPVAGEDEATPLQTPDENPDQDEGAGEVANEGVTESDLSSMSVEELRSLARDRGVDSSGRKRELIDRLAADFAAGDDDEDGAGPDDGEED